MVGAATVKGRTVIYQPAGLYVPPGSARIVVQRERSRTDGIITTLVFVLAAF